jgi:hypothetical protein
LGSLHGLGGGQRGGHGTAAHEEDAAVGRHGRRRKKRLGVGHVGQKSEQASGAAAPIGPKSEEKSFWKRNWIFEFTKVLKICTRRFRRNFDVGISPKFF